MMHQHADSMSTAGPDFSWLDQPYNHPNYYSDNEGRDSSSAPNTRYSSTTNIPLVKRQLTSEVVIDRGVAPAYKHDAESQRRSTIIQSLARSYVYSRRHTPNPGGILTPRGTSITDSVLDPDSDIFNATEWAKAFVEMVSEGGGSFRSAGVCFQDLNVHGFGTGSDFQKDVANVWLSLAQTAGSYLSGKRQRIDILRQFDGVVRKGEMLVVLGPPGSGCSTLLKTIAGETNGLRLGEGSYFNYQGMSAKEMHTHHRGESIYTAEVDVHFPMLSVSDTLTFAARARQPHLAHHISTTDLAAHLRDVVMAMFGISHTANSPVGNDFIRGISGGERKRLTICEAFLSNAALQCWDNSTRGLDSANAIEFCKNLRIGADVFGSSVCVAIYQAPQSAYDLFDKATVLYEGRQIYFGRADEAKRYFEEMGFDCPARQTTPDFLTSMTAPAERVRCIRPGWEDKVPRTPDEFVARWRRSRQFWALQREIVEFKGENPLGATGGGADEFRESKRRQQARVQRRGSPFMLSYVEQIRLCIWRGWRRLKGDPSLTIGGLVGNFILALIVGSVFYDLGETSSSFFQRGSCIFFACLLNAFSSALEILTLFAQRPIVEKHSRYALYHPSAEAISSMICDLPFKITNAFTFNLTLYFLTNLRREPGPFFFYLLISFSTGLVMSMIFRTIASTARTLFQALVPAGIMIIDIVMFAGFIIPKRYILDWCRWLSYIDPLSYAFEALIVNEFHGRRFACDDFVPSRELDQYRDVNGENHVCRSVGSRPGLDFVLGDDYINSQFEYEWGNRWKNYGIIIAFTFVLMMCYMVAAETVSAKKSKGEVLIYRLGRKAGSMKHVAKGGGRPIGSGSDVELGDTVGSAIMDKWNGSDGVSGGMLQQQSAVLTWRDLCYDINIKKETRRILDHVDGYIKPGTLTALMGVSGAGKTSLLDCLANRNAIGLVSGEIIIDGIPRDQDPSFQRKTGYVQQQDLHLPTSTVREALSFSAVLRQPAHIPRAEKLAYVEEVIKLLKMEEYADAVIGTPGLEGLNVEQRKHLTIAVELAARPPFLLFVDEPTSGLDSQTSWAILDLLERLTKAGQAVLCTIHQPSAMLFQRFDRLLFLARGGKTVYFGEIGEDSKTLTSYFERYNGGVACPPDANPAEWMLEAIGAAPGSTSDVDWFRTWRDSPEYRELQADLDNIQAAATERHQRQAELDLRSGGSTSPVSPAAVSHSEFAAPFPLQLRENLYRVFQQYWRTPTYIYSKLALCTLISLFIGFVFFRVPLTIQGLQSQLFSIFSIFTIFGQIVQQTLPQFVIQRSLYEARERPSKVYSWQVFMLSQILVELPWNALMAVFMYASWYYPVGLYKNAEAADQVTERGVLVFLFLLLFMVFAGTFATFMISGQETAEAGGNIADLLFNLCLIFCGILVTIDDLPRFWVFMNRVSPFTYLAAGILASGVANTNVVCADNELLTFRAVDGLSCGEYMATHEKELGGYLVDAGNATVGAMCQFCPISDTNKYLEAVNISYGDRWRNFGIMWVYVLVNIAGALFLYWLARVPKRKQLGKAKSA